MDKAVLVTGGAGYIGSHACKALAQAGYVPVTFDNLSYGHIHAVKWGPLETGDLQNYGDIQAALQKHKPIAVIHFAAYALVGESVRDPGKYYANNVGGTLNLIEAMRAENIDKLVFSSTCATYGEPETVPIDESVPQNPVNPYGRSKLVVEHMLKEFETAHGVRHVALRYFNACGADQEGEIGEEHEPETHLIPRILQGLANTGPALSVFGQDYPTPDGTCVRDYIHVEDLADAHIKALEYLLKGGYSVQLNLGTGEGYSVMQIIEAVERVTGKAVDYTVGPRRPGDPPALVAKTDAAKDVIGFQARASDLDTIISSAWNFMQKTAS